MVADDDLDALAKLLIPRLEAVSERAWVESGEPQKQRLRRRVRTLRGEMKRLQGDAVRVRVELADAQREMEGLDA